MTEIRPVVLGKAAVEGLKNSYEKKGELAKEYMESVPTVVLVKDVFEGKSLNETLNDTAYAKMTILPNTVKYIGNSIANSPLVVTAETIAKAGREYDTNKTNQDDPVKKGARIGAGVQLGIDATAVGLGGLMLSELTGTTFSKGLKTLYDGMIKTAGSKGKLGAIAAFGIASSALIGAGIGKLIKNHQNKEQDK